MREIYANNNSAAHVSPEILVKDITIDALLQKRVADLFDI